MSAWFDTETKALMAPNPPETLAPPHAAGFSLVMLEAGGDFRRMATALARVRTFTAGTIRTVLARPCPNILCHSISHADALLGQFEMVCCDAVVVFIADGVIRTTRDGYLTELYAWLRESHEFEKLPVEVRAVPDTSEGVQFLLQFLGWLPGEADAPERRLPLKTTMLRKKARIMRHWAEKIGAEMSVQGS
jgi:hypothetical protein